MNDDIGYKAIILITEIRRALEAGTKHYDLEGNPLLNERQIIEALLKDKQIIIEPIKKEE